MKRLERILYVEDESHIRMVANMALTIVGGLEVRLCSSGAEALAAAEEFAPDLMLLDVMMPGMDGPTLILALRERPNLAQIPFIFMTAKVQPQEVAYFKSLGALDLIFKPFDPMKLAMQLRRIYEEHNERK